MLLMVFRRLKREDMNLGFSHILRLCEHFDPACKICRHDKSFTLTLLIHCVSQMQMPMPPPPASGPWGSTPGPMPPIPPSVPMPGMRPGSPPPTEHPLPPSWQQGGPGKIPAPLPRTGCHFRSDERGHALQPHHDGVEGMRQGGIQRRLAAGFPGEEGHLAADAAARMAVTEGPEAFTEMSAAWAAI